MKNLVWKYSLPGHSKIKSKILNIIQDYNQINYCPDPITKTDYYDGSSYDINNKKYLQLFFEESKSLYESITNHYWVKDLIPINAWFQQYCLNDTHKWHIHGGSNISIVYFVELDDSKYSTEFINSEENKIFQIEDTREGDVIIFPSHVLHRSPPLNRSKRKTCISMNIELQSPKIDECTKLDPSFKKGSQTKT